MNKAILIGNLTKDPEITTTTNGTSVAKFTIAIQRRFENQNGERETDFLNVVAWKQLAENVHKYTKKGSKVAVVGTIQNRTYEAPDGSKRYITEIVADEVEFLNSKSEEEKKDKPSKLLPLDDDNISDLPF